METAAGLSKRVETALYELEDCAGRAADLLSRLEFDPAELDRVEARLDLIRRLVSKYGPESPTAGVC